jgi:excisionase family DNA binding protein
VTRPVEPPVLRVPEVARRLDVSAATVYRYIERGELPAIRLGRSVRVSRRVFEEWVERGGRAA